MSMNLIYDHVGENGEYVCCEEFPFQTPTELTYRVVGTKDKSKQIAIIKEALIAWGCDDVESQINEITEMLNNPKNITAK